MNDKVTLQQILDATYRLPHGNYERSLALEFIRTSRERNRDLSVGTDMFPASEDSLTRLFDEGVMILSSPEMLETAFLFVKVDAGRNFLGWQRSVFSCYLGALDADAWSEGPTFKRWREAVTSLTDLYRSSGF